MEIRLMLGDCLERMAEIPDGSVDAIITDPPYNVGLEYASHDDRMADYSRWCQGWMSELRRVCRGSIAISVGQSNLSMWAALDPPIWWLAWWKPAAMGRCVVGFNNWEPIAIYGKPTSQACDVIRVIIRPDDDVTGHPCPKPIEWATKQIEMLSEPDNVVLDPFMGSGTTGVACVELGRSFIGIEKDPAYFTLSQSRIGRTKPNPGGVRSKRKLAASGQTSLF